MSKLKCILWDMDGTIIDTNPIHERAYLETLKPEGRTDFTYEAFKGVRTFEVFQQLGFDEAKSKALTKVKQLKALESIPEAKVIPGALDLISKMHSLGLSQKIVTGASLRFSSAVLKALNLSPPLDLIVTADSPTPSKPNPQAFYWACEQLGYSRNETAIIEDSEPVIKNLIGGGFLRLFLKTTRPDSNNRHFCSFQDFVEIQDQLISLRG